MWYTQYINYHLSLSSSIHGPSMCSEIKFAVYMLIGTHWTACLWYFIACPSIYMTAWDSHTCGEDTWAYRYANYSGIPLSNVPYTHVYKYNHNSKLWTYMVHGRQIYIYQCAFNCLWVLSSLISTSYSLPPPPLLSTVTAGNQSLAYQYVVSLYWAVSTTANVGYGDIYAHTDLEVGIACMCTCAHNISHYTSSTYNTVHLPILLHTCTYVHDAEDIFLASYDVWHCGLWVHHCQCGC